jgi:subtilase family serine protease
VLSKKLQELSLRAQGAPTYHKWITQDQFNASYGPTSQEVDAVKNFLTGQGLTVLAVAENNAYMKVQGTVGAIQKAFHVQINGYSLKGKNYRSNKSDPSVNGQAGKYIAAITGMDDLGFRPAIAQASDPDGKPFPARPLGKNRPAGVFFEGQAFRPPQTAMLSNATNTATYTGNRYGADITNNTLGHLPPQGYSPGEVRTAYGLNALYQAGFDGTGETIVITDAYGSATIQQDAASIFGGLQFATSGFDDRKGTGDIKQSALRGAKLGRGNDVGCGVGSRDCTRRQDRARTCHGPRITRRSN